MISRPHRFHGHNSLRFVYQKGKVVRGQTCMLKYVANPKRTSYRAAVVVSKKVHKSAVVRNRIRRRIYEALRLCEIQKNVDLVYVVFDEKIANMPTQDIFGGVRTHLQKAGIIPKQ
ncbi:MAG: ribonuclease P protein component [Candidatus Saccharimonadales bacterium]